MEELLVKNNNLMSFKGLNEYSQDFLSYVDIDKNSMRIYRVGIKSFIDYLDNNNIKHPTRDDLMAYRDMLRENYSSSTTNTYMIAIRAFFRYLKLNGIYEDISVNVKGAKYDTTPRKQILSLEQTKEIYNNLTDLREKCLFSLLITTGLRGIEVQRANIEDIKLHNGEMVLWVQCKKHSEKDEYVKLSNQVLDDIKNYIGNRTSGSLLISTSNENYGERISITSIRKIIKNIFKRFGLDEDTFSLHSCRRTCATLMYENDVDEHSIQQILHHKSLNTTMRYINAVTRNNNSGEKVVSNLLFS